MKTYFLFYKEQTKQIGYTTIAKNIPADFKSRVCHGEDRLEYMIDLLTRML